MEWNSGMEKQNRDLKTALTIVGSLGKNSRSGDQIIKGPGPSLGSRTTFSLTGGPRTWMKPEMLKLRIAEQQCIT